MFCNDNVVVIRLNSVFLRSFLRFVLASIRFQNQNISRCNLCDAYINSSIQMYGANIQTTKKFAYIISTTFLQFCINQATKTNSRIHTRTALRSVRALRTVYRVSSVLQIFTKYHRSSRRYVSLVHCHLLLTVISVTGAA